MVYHHIFPAFPDKPVFQQAEPGTDDGNDSTNCTQQSQAEGAVAVIEKVLGTCVAANLALRHMEPLEDFMHHVP